MQLTIPPECRQFFGQMMGWYSVLAERNRRIKLPSVIKGGMKRTEKGTPVRFTTAAWVELTNSGRRELNEVVAIKGENYPYKVETAGVGVEEEKVPYPVVPLRMTRESQFSWLLIKAEELSAIKTSLGINDPGFLANYGFTPNTTFKPLIRFGRGALPLVSLTDTMLPLDWVEGFYALMGGRVDGWEQGWASLSKRRFIPWVPNQGRAPLLPWWALGSDFASFSYLDSSRFSLLLEQNDGLGILEVRDWGDSESGEIVRVHIPKEKASGESSAIEIEGGYVFSKRRSGVISYLGFQTGGAAACRKGRAPGTRRESVPSRSLLELPNAACSVAELKGRLPDKSAPKVRMKADEQGRLHVGPWVIERNIIPGQECTLQIILVGERAEVTVISETPTGHVERVPQVFEIKT